MLLFIVFITLVACNDGDIVVSDFDFDQETQLNLCRVENINVLSSVNQETNEAISLAFQQSDFDGRFEGLCPPEPIVIDLNATNKVTYRRLSESTSSQEYFCQQVPPSSPEVIDEYESTNGGQATIYFSIAEQDDNDGVPAIEEDLVGNGNLYQTDTDGDGIPDFLDNDDDNDNVRTIVEIVNEDGDDFPDTDGDGVPNYLDPDDDGDGVISRYEALDAYDTVDEEGNPTNLSPNNSIGDDNIPYYLNPNATEELVIDLYRSHTISRTYRVQVVITDVTLQRLDGEEAITFSTLQLGNYEVTDNNVELEMTFEAPEDCQDQYSNFN
ncbi:MAG: hypothetical protein ACQESK_02900 [Bacteroidota bacterium]